MWSAHGPSDFVDGEVFGVNIINMVSTYLGSMCLWTACG